MEINKRKVFHFQAANGRIPFRDWINKLKDLSGRAAILKRLDRAEEGLLGDHKYVGNGVWELRINYGPGYRVYFAEVGSAIILLLAGGDKSSQKRDLRKAHKNWDEYRTTK